MATSPRLAAFFPCSLPHRSALCIPPSSDPALSHGTLCLICFPREKAPVTPEDWEEEFAKYKSSPEFKKVNSRMTVEARANAAARTAASRPEHCVVRWRMHAFKLHTFAAGSPFDIPLARSHNNNPQEFKYIFWWEYAHRMWGRFLGVFFAVPLGFFVAKGYIRPPLLRRLGLFFLAGASQGLVVRWMRQPYCSSGSCTHASALHLVASLCRCFDRRCFAVWGHRFTAGLVDGEERAGAAPEGVRGAAREPLPPRDAPHHRLRHLHSAAVDDDGRHAARAAACGAATRSLSISSQQQPFPNVPIFRH